MLCDFRCSVLVSVDCTATALADQRSLPFTTACPHQSGYMSIHVGTCTDVLALANLWYLCSSVDMIFTAAYGRQFGGNNLLQHGLCWWNIAFIENQWGLSSYPAAKPLIFMMFWRINWKIVGIRLARIIIRLWVLWLTLHFLAWVAAVKPAL